MTGHLDSHVFLGMPAVIRSARMRDLLETVRRVARTNATVLIEGESGSGKELIARAVHHYSMRCAKPWVDVSCGALPEHLVESELFGYEKGAFSGADAPKPGLFELADTGTLFLDEIGELEPKMQVKLLRVLDGTPYYRLGGLRKISVNVRVVAATNRPLDAAARAGRFREDLYHRLSQIVLRVPPLRDRREDILPLARFFLARHDAARTLAAEAEAALLAYRWPGNVRELRNVMLQSAVLAAGDEVGFHDLPAALRVGEPAAADAGPANLNQIERQTILQVLEQTNGHQQKAAALLGISRRTLSRKLKLYGVRSIDPAPGAARVVANA
ncbi:MAG: sigma-54 interaction domain-containing protein [Bryobacteraceae bacterium]